MLITRSQEEAVSFKVMLKGDGGDEASLTNLNAGRDKILFYYRRVNCAINNDIRHKIVYCLLVKRGMVFCYIFAGIGDDSRIFRFLVQMR